MWNFMKSTVQKEKYLSRAIQELKVPAIAQINALNTVLSSLNSKMSENETDLLELTLHSCNYMHKLIDTLHKILNPKQEKITLAYSKFDIADLQNEVIKELNILIKYSTVKIEQECKSGILISADRMKLKCVIENILMCIIKNACKNSTIKIKTEVKDSKIYFSVQSDNLIERKLLYEIFNKNTNEILLKKYSLAWLGLYQSKEIINAHFGCMINEYKKDNTNILGFCIPV